MIVIRVQRFLTENGFYAISSRTVQPLLIKIDFVLLQCARPFESDGGAFAPEEVSAKVLDWPWLRWNNPAMCLFLV